MHKANALVASRCQNDSHARAANGLTASPVIPAFDVSRRSGVARPSSTLAFEGWRNDGRRSARARECADASQGPPGVRCVGLAGLNRWHAM
jgi:hypothetical protein